MANFFHKIINANTNKEGRVVVQAPLASGWGGDNYTQDSPTPFALPNTGAYNVANSGRFNDYTYYSA